MHALRSFNVCDENKAAASIEIFQRTKLRTSSFQRYRKAMGLTFKGLYDVTGSSLAFAVK